MTLQPSDYIVGIVIFTLVLVSGIFMLHEFQDQDSSYIDGDKFVQFNRTFNRMDNVINETGSLREGIMNADPDPSTFGQVFGVINSLVSTGWQTLKLLFSSFAFFDDIINGLTTFFGVPAFVPLLIGLIITVSLVFAIYSAVFGKEV